MKKKKKCSKKIISLHHAPRSTSPPFRVRQPLHYDSRCVTPVGQRQVRLGAADALSVSSLTRPPAAPAAPPPSPRKRPTTRPRPSRRAAWRRASSSAVATTRLTRAPTRSSLGASPRRKARRARRPLQRGVAPRRATACAALRTVELRWCCSVLTPRRRRQSGLPVRGRPCGRGGGRRGRAVREAVNRPAFVLQCCEYCLQRCVTRRPVVGLVC